MALDGTDPLLNPTPLAPTTAERREADALRRRAINPRLDHLVLQSPGQVSPVSPEVAEEQSQAQPRPKPIAHQFMELRSKQAIAEFLIANRGHFELENMLSSMKVRLDLRELDMTKVRGDVRHLPYNKLDLTGAKADGLDFTGADMSHAHMPKASFAGSLFGPQTNIGHANFEGGQFVNAYMNGVRGEHVKMNDANLKDFTAESSGFAYGQFRGAEVNNMKMLNSEISHTSWTGAKGRGADFTGSAGKEVDMENIAMPDVKIPSGIALRKMDGNVEGADIAVVNTANVAPNVVAQSRRTETGYGASSVQQAMAAVQNAVPVPGPGVNLAERYKKMGIDMGDAPMPPTGRG